MDSSIRPISREAPAVAAPPPIRNLPGRQAKGPDPAAPGPAQEAARQPVNEEFLNGRVEELNHAIKAADEHLQFSVHKGTHQIVVKLMDNKTDEVLREFPSEKFLDLVVELQKIAGLRVDTKL